MNVSSAAARYLSWSRTQSRLLEPLLPIVTMHQTISPVLDIPPCSSAAAIDQLILSANKAGYSGFNVGISKLQNNEISYDTFQHLRSRLPVKAAHGSSIKRALKTGKSFKTILEEDLAMLEIYDPDNSWVVNYDTFAGHLPGLPWRRHFRATQDQNLKELVRALRIKTSGNLGFALLETIVSEVASVFRTSQRTICFEIPGTKGWSMYPDLEVSIIRELVRLFNTYLPEATLCIDVGHVLTWTRDNERLTQFVDDLDPYWRYVRMIHVSSAGSWANSFVSLYRQVYGDDRPLWHVKGLDLQLPVCEPEQCIMLQKMRNHYANAVLEVSETRLPSLAIADYFSGYVDLATLDDSTYHQDLIEQGKILGYR